MVAALDEGDVELDIRLQLQTDPHLMPIENNAVLWPERLSITPTCLTGESDPLLGNREPIPGCPVTSDFNIPQEGGLRQRVSELPQFVTVRGGA